MYSSHERFLYSLFVHQQGEINLYLFYSDIEEETLEELKRFCSNWAGKTLIPIKMELAKLRNLYSTEKLPVELYYKLLCVYFLPRELSRILCLDLDMVVNKPLDTLYETNLDGYPLAACADIYAYIFGEGERNHTRLNIDRNYHYFNGGMLLLNLDYLREFRAGEVLLEYAFSNRENLKWLEQDVMNHFFAEKYLELNGYEYNCVPVMYIMKVKDVQNGIIQPLHKNEVEQMEALEGYADYTQALCDNATIIHYIGESKPWDAARPDAGTYRIFDRYYLEYAAHVKDR